VEVEEHTVVNPENEGRTMVNFYQTIPVYEGPGIESRWVEIFRTSPDRLRGQPSLLYNG
jgi:hypothetical protein